MSQNFIEVVTQGPKDIESAEKVIKISVYVTVIVALLTVGLAIAGFYQSSNDPKLDYLLDPYSLLDGILLSIFAFFLYKRKLWAAIALVLHQTAGFAVLWIEFNKFPGVIPIFKIILYISAIRGIYLINSINSPVTGQNA
jgi:hypothetical protein